MSKISTTMLLAVASVAHAAELPVIPASMTGTASYEIGDVVLALLPLTDTHPAWGWTGKLPLKWQGPKRVDAMPNGWTTVTRFGNLRLNVRGAVVTVQNGGEKELSGTIGLFYGGTSDNIASPNSIMVGYDDHCWDVGSEGCDFDPISSLQQAGLSLQLRCQTNAGATKGTNTIYWISAPGREQEQLIVFHHFDFGKWTTSMNIALRGYDVYNCPVGQ